MFAAHYGLDNLTVFLDFNGLQIDGKITDVIDPTPLDEKFRAFGWNVIVIDGHNFDEIESAVEAAKAHKGKPTAVIAHTVKGKGLSFAENVTSYHNSALTAETYRQALEELA